MRKDPGLAFLSEVSSVPLQQALRHQHTAVSAFFARHARYPRFKSRAARAHRKVRSARRDFLHRASTRLVRENDIIVIEELNVSGMVRNRRGPRDLRLRLGRVPPPAGVQVGEE